MKVRDVVAILMALAACRSAPPASPAPPNIVLIVADDLGWGDLGCYGQTKIRTPELDRMAREGLRFTQFYAGAPVCAPSRCTLLTGMHSGHAYIRDNREVQPEGQEPIADDVVTLAELLSARGYATCAVGKWGLGGPGSCGHPNAQGFERWFGYLCQRDAHNYYPTHLWRDGERVELAGNARGATGARYSHDVIVDEALAFLREPREQPFFLYVAFTIPHVALQVPDDSLAEYRGAFPDEPYGGEQGYLPHPTPHAAYAAMVSRMDRDVGRILGALCERGIEDETLVVFTSDNGPTHGRVGGADSAFFASAGPFRGLKGSVHEGGLRVPLIVHWPGHAASGVSAHVAASWDLLPTLCEIAGANAPAGVDGVSFAPTLLARGEQRSHDYLYWEFPGYGGQRALRMGAWKLVQRDLSREQPQLALYDLATDQSESRDVAGRHPAIVARALELMDDAHVDSALFPLPVHAK